MVQMVLRISEARCAGGHHYPIYTRCSKPQVMEGDPVMQDGACVLTSIPLFTGYEITLYNRPVSSR